MMTIKPGGLAAAMARLDQVPRRAKTATAVMTAAEHVRSQVFERSQAPLTAGAFRP